jgi:murein DD-endopeptidase MepM/ murein hydrolase activator NlpD
MLRCSAVLLLFAVACTSPPSAPGGSRALPAASNSAEPEPAPALARAAAQPPVPPSVPPLKPTFSWVLPVDHGVRNDDGGEGGFLAPRYHGRHNGLDLLAPLGTPVLAPCEGKARAGESRSFGRWVQLVCALPNELGAGRTLFASFFYSHLSKTVAVRGRQPAEPIAVRRGASVGAVGKSGNASGAKIAPHLHLEVTIHADEASALADTHSGRDQSSTPAAELFLRELTRRCLEPNGLAPRSGASSRARRVDPFLLLVCLAGDKPAFSTPRAPLDRAAERWSLHYSAARFQVDAPSAQRSSK